MVYRSLIVLLLTLLLALGVQAQEPDWSWLSGHWREISATDVAEEHWSSPAANGLLAFSRRVSKIDQQQKAFEFLRITKLNEHWVFRALPSGRGETDFILVKFDAQSAEFSNPQHDFPQTIRYWRVEQRLCATVSGQYKGQFESETTCWQRGE